MWLLVGNLVRVFFPGPQRGERLFLHHLNHRNRALGKGLRKFLVDERVVETNLGSVGGNIAVVNASQAGPVDRAKTHWTGLAGGIDLAIMKVEGVEFGACFSDGNQFGVRRRIVDRCDAIYAFGDDATVFHDYGAEGPAFAGEHIIDGELNGAGHERVVHVLWTSVNGLPKPASEFCRKAIEHGLVRSAFAEKEV